MVYMEVRTCAGMNCKQTHVIMWIECMHMHDNKLVLTHTFVCAFHGKIFLFLTRTCTHSLIAFFSQLCDHTLLLFAQS